MTIGPSRTSGPFCLVRSLTIRFVGVSGLYREIRILPLLTYIPIWGLTNQRIWVEMEYGPCHLKNPQYPILFILNEPASFSWVCLHSFPFQDNARHPAPYLFLGSYISEARTLNHRQAFQMLNTPSANVNFLSLHESTSGWCQCWSEAIALHDGEVSSLDLFEI